MPDNDTQYFSEEGLAKLKQEVEERKTKTRHEIADRLEYAKSLGDLSENSEYQEAKESQMLNESRIMELEDSIRRAVLITKGDKKGVVQVGSRLVAEAEGSKNPTTFSIVGSHESNPSENKISHESPLGRAFLGHKKGDMVEAHTPRGVAKYRIVEVG